MPRVKTIRTVMKRVEQEEEVHQAPKFGIGDYVEVYSGDREGHNFWIKDIRYDHDHQTYEYFYGSFMSSWHVERQLVLVEKAKPSPVSKAPPQSYDRNDIRKHYEALMVEGSRRFKDEALTDLVLAKVQVWLREQEAVFLPPGYPGARVCELDGSIGVYPHAMAPVGGHNG